MKVIETLYKDYLFRSRTEARFAVFWDVIGEKWQHETEGFDLDGDWYLPDFFLPRMECFIEIKGPRPTEKEIRLCRKLQFFAEKNVAIFHGLPNENDGILFGWSENHGGEFVESLAAWTIDDGFLAFTDYPNGESEILQNAARRAKQARFEYGQTPEIAASRPYPNIVNYEDIAF